MPLKSSCSAKHRSKESAQLAEKSAAGRRIRRCRLRARWFRPVSGRKRRAQWGHRDRTRIQRQCAYILKRRRRRSGCVKHEGRCDLDTKFVGRNGDIQRRCGRRLIRRCCVPRWRCFCYRRDRNLRRVRGWLGVADHRRRGRCAEHRFSCRGTSTLKRDGHIHAVKLSGVKH